MNEHPFIKSWRCLGSTTVFQNRWLRVDIDQVELPDGRAYDYTVLRRPHHGAAILAFDPNGRVLIQQEYRYPVDSVIWQLPGGLIDPAESPLEAAQRELAEETGYVAASWRLLGTFWDNPAFEDLVVHIFLAEDTHPDGGEHRDDAEWVHSEWKEMAWVKEQVRAGVIRERVILSALGFLWAEG